jgi:hypothetical protein
VINSAGFSPTPFGLLADMELRAHCDFLHAWSYDIMHTTFQDGFMSNAMWLLCLNIARTKYHSNYESLVRHIRECQVPMGRGSIKCIYNQLFSEKMVKKHTARKAIVANASVQFSLYPILLDWALMELDADVEEHVAVYTAACAVIDVYKRIKHRRLSTAAAKPIILAAYEEWMKLHKALYGTSNIKPKFFWMWTVCRRISKEEWLFDMFCIERLHKRVRPHAEMIKNGVSWESAVLARVLDSQICFLKQASPIDRNFTLEGAVTTNAGGEVSSCRCICNGTVLNRNDIVMNGNRAGVILKCIDANGQLLVEVELLQKARLVWMQTPSVALWSAREAYHPTAWRQGDNGLVLIM